MKNAPLVFACSTVLGLAAISATAPAARATSLSLSGDHVHLARHQDLAAARTAITTEDGKVTMVLTNRVVAIQLSDRTLHRVRRDLREKQEDQQDNVLASVIVKVVTRTVGEVIDHSFACCVRNLRDVSYEDGRLVFTGRNGRRVFEDADVCDTDVLAAFSPKDARNFVSEFRRLKAGF
jgi:hypothetical protein